ncbi:unnamed protein product [Caenorhabditis auriculariae]|uniref:DUF7087 domain-containing protein n=1 Tax=Caenorhabditis auriculariae TaxID=2777116 RepID=A0A8S1HB02_9PELO|nr:unnamed protein product [Caenorhabditis auriculariae]
MDEYTKIMRKVMASYEFPNFVIISRLIQFLCTVLQVLFIYMESGSLSFYTFLTYSAIVGMNAVHLFRRWYYYIDGRYDVRQLLREHETTPRLQYSIALFSPLVLGLTTWFVVELSTPFFDFCLHVATMLQLILSFVQLCLEFYEVLRKAA